MTDNGEDAGFLTRWSQRKLEAKSARVEPEQTAADQPEAQERTEEAAADAEQARLQAEEQARLAALSEEDVARLGPDSDYTIFMKAGVSEHVRRLALRKLWRSDPVLANLDGLIDYGEEVLAQFNAGKPAATTWQIGRGYLAELELDGGGEDGVAGTAAAGDAAGVDAGQHGERGPSEDDSRPLRSDADEPMRRSHVQSEAETSDDNV